MISKRRNKALKPDPNPLFKLWIREWKDEAERKGWKTKYVYAKALKSLDHFPLVLKSGKEAIILESFGEKICQMLDDKLAEYRASGGVIACTAPPLSVDSDSDSNGSVPSSIPISSPSKNNKPQRRKRKAQKQWIPGPGTGAYAILIAMHIGQVEMNLNYFKKQELIVRAQPLSDTSFTVPSPGSHYTAWSSMGILIKKEMVKKEGNPPRYSLTELGVELALKLFVATQQNTSSDVLKPNEMPESDSELSQCPSTQPSQDSKPIFPNRIVNRFTMEPGSFDVILCVDNCEITGGSEAVASRKQLVIQELQKNGVMFEVRKLHVGDFLWIARERVQPVPGQLRLKEACELVLDFVVERKRLDDLAKSIKDGRFHEQKFRLQNSGVRHPVYLVEDYGNDSYQYGIPRQALFQAINNTQVINGFIVKRTRDQKDSAAYLTHMTRALSRTYSCRTLQSCTDSEIREETSPPNSFLKFKEFNTSSMKNKVMTAKEMFVKQLLQLSGLSVEKAVAITDLYDTPSKLMNAYENCESLKEKEKMLAGIKYGQNRRNLGPALSKVLFTFYMTDFRVE